MREIKFRAWLPSLEKMTYPHTLDVLISKYNNEWSNGTNRWMQYTGLKDKYGNEIYEGDIVRMTEYGDQTIVEVRYMGDEDYPAFDIVPHIECGCNALSYAMAVCDVEVIGNVYENQELLEE